MVAMPKVIVILGPTASGKTALSVALALKLKGEIISADSRQVYTGLDIGTGKVTREEMRGVPHHLLDVVDPSETYNANDFVRDGREAIQLIVERGGVPIVAGGTGFYIDALLGRAQLANVPRDEAIRSELSGFSLEELQTELERLDPERFENIDTKNKVRLIRAIEVARAGPKTRSSTLEPRILYDALYIGLTIPPPELKKKIHARLKARMDEGMLDETKRLHANGLSFDRMEGLGLEYRYMARHIIGKISYEEMMEQLEREIIRYAKRQRTWFKRNKETKWLSPEQEEQAFDLAKNFLERN